MAGTFSFFGVNDINSGINTKIYEGVVISSSVIHSSSYNNLNVKTFSHGMFETIYDYPYASSSANALFSITVGTSSTALAPIDAANKKIIFDHYSYMCFGVDPTGSIIPLNYSGSSAPLVISESIRRPVIIELGRTVSKDEIKKGSFSLRYCYSNAYNWTIAAPSIGTISDSTVSETGGFLSNSPLGEYSLLYDSTASKYCGLLFYKQGVAVIAPELTMLSSSAINFFSESAGTVYSLTGSFDYQNIGAVSNNFKDRIDRISFSSSTNLYSTTYNCSAASAKFLHSSNPTFVSSSGLIKTVKVNSFGQSQTSPVAYITTIGLYSANNELLAVAKLSEPQKVSEMSQPSFKIKLDY